MLSNALGLILAGFFPVEVPDTAAEQLSPLRGQWSLVCTRDEKRTEAGTDQMRMTVRPDGTVLLTSGLLPPTEGTLRTVSCVRGNRLVLVLADGRTLPGVFELKADSLVICFDEAGKPCPAEVAP